MQKASRVAYSLAKAIYSISPCPALLESQHDLNPEEVPAGLVRRAGDRINKFRQKFSEEQSHRCNWHRTL